MSDLPASIKKSQWKKNWIMKGFDEEESSLNNFEDVLVQRLYRWSGEQGQIYTQNVQGYTKNSASPKIAPFNYFLSLIGRTFVCFQDLSQLLDFRF